MLAKFSIMTFRNIFLMRLNAFTEGALKIIYSDISSYQAALDKLNMVTVWERREKLCTEFFNSVVNDEKS